MRANRKPEYTTVIGLDLDHLSEALYVLPTWRRNRPDVWANPMLVFCDAVEPVQWWQARTHDFLCSHPDVRFIPVPLQGATSQRRRMLSAFVYGVAEHCKTERFLKIDTDAPCMFDHPDWMPTEWLGKDVVFVASKWGYTRPPSIWQELCQWGNTYVSWPKDEPPGVLDVEKNRVNHARMISYVMLGRTDFMRKIADLAQGPVMPCDSQDTLVWYVAYRLGLPYILTKMNRFGWSHSRRRLPERCWAAMHGVQQ